MYKKPKEQQYISSPVGLYKKHVRSIAWRALLCGQLKKCPCVVCGEERVEMHHNDYSKPLEITWLCKKHHLELHSRDRKPSTICRDCGKPKEPERVYPNMLASRCRKCQNAFNKRRNLERGLTKPKKDKQKY